MIKIKYEHFLNSEYWILLKSVTQQLTKINKRGRGHNKHWGGVWKQIKKKTSKWNNNLALESTVHLATVVIHGMHEIIDFSGE